MGNIPPTVYAKIIKWANGNLLQPQDELCRDEAFLYIDGIDYYVYGDAVNGDVKFNIKKLTSLDDLPVMLPSEVPAEVYLRLEAKGKRGFIRRTDVEDHSTYITDNIKNRLA